MTALRYPSILSALALLASCVSCGGDPAALKANVYRMGDRATAGPVTYVGLTADYRMELPGAKESLKNRYLVIFLSATNGSGEEITLPHTRLIAADGTEIPEVTEIQGFPQWMGILRRVAPSGTEQGYVVFDVPVGAYKLQVSSGGDPEKEQIAQIEIPAKITPGGVAGPALGN
jgi:hypothetical protein